MTDLRRKGRGMSHCPEERQPLTWCVPVPSGHRWTAAQRAHFSDEEAEIQGPEGRWCQPRDWLLRLPLCLALFAQRCPGLCCSVGTSEKVGPRALVPQRPTHSLGTRGQRSQPGIGSFQRRSRLPPRGVRGKLMSTGGGAGGAWEAGPAAASWALPLPSVPPHRSIRPASLEMLPSPRQAPRGPLVPRGLD